MKKSFIAGFAATAFAALAVSSCSYYVYPIEVERRGPSETGLDLVGKTMSVSFVQKDIRDSLKQSAMADAFAVGLEKLYFDGEPSVELFSLKNVEGADYSSRDTLVNLIMSTDVDVAFLFDEPQYSHEISDTTYTLLTLYAYDATAKIDSVLTFTGKKKFNSSSSFAVNSGVQLSKFFDSTWTKETYQIYLYDEMDWKVAAYHADAMEWDKALEKWLEIASSTKNTEKRSLASYNAALACYMLGNKEYALKWLEAAEKEGQVNQANSLRAKIAKM